MSGLERVSFKTGRMRLPRLSPPRVPGRRHERFWTEEQKEVLRTYYPTGGLAACAAHLPPHKQSRTAIYGQAHKLGLRSKKPVGGPKQKLNVPADIDDQIRAIWPNLDGKKRGAINALAARLDVPRWWLSKRAVRLGLSMPYKKEPPWTAAELALMTKVPLHDPHHCAAIFREHGFVRTPTAVMTKAKRLNLSRRFREGFSAIQAAAIVGFDPKNFGTMILAGDVKAERRQDRRLPQQGGSRWVITAAALREFVLANIDRIDLRKVDKHGFVQLLINAPLENERPAAAVVPADGEPTTRAHRLLLWEGQLFRW